MKGILMVTKRDEKGEKIKKAMLFDTENSEKICDVVNRYGVAVKEIHIGKNGTLFACDKKTSEIEVVDQESAKEYIGKKYPEKYLKYFGEVEEV